MTISYSQQSWITALTVLGVVALGSVMSTLLSIGRSDLSTASTLLEVHRDRSSSSFDAIVKVAYERAFSNAPKPKRKTFDLANWTRGTGGLTDPDRILLASIYGNASSVFEYGLGESTFIASHVGVPRYAGIDSDAVWVSQTRDAVHPHFRFYLADVGKTGMWGMPNDLRLPKSLLDYQIAPLLLEPYPFDVYMVDGRMRFGCMMASFLHASHRGAPLNHTIVLNHDCAPTLDEHNNLFKGSRNVYKAADHLLDLVYHSDRLCAYRRKSNTTDADLQELWQAHHMDWNR